MVPCCCSCCSRRSTGSTCGRSRRRWPGPRVARPCASCRRRSWPAGAAALTGYPSIGTLVRGLVTILPPDGPKRGGFFGAVSPWELSTVYVAPAGLALLVAGIVLFVRRVPGSGLFRLAGPTAVLAVLALGDAGVLLGSRACRSSRPSA